jgi:hypothetical protein
MTITFRSELPSILHRRENDGICTLSCLVRKKRKSSVRQNFSPESYCEKQDENGKRGTSETDQFLAQPLAKSGLVQMS